MVIASIHNRYGMDAEAMTARLIGLMRQPAFKIWGHALGRILLRRDPVACDLEAVLAEAARSRVAIEVNGDPRRLDLPPEHLRAARRLGIPSWSRPMRTPPAACTSCPMASRWPGGAGFTPAKCSTPAPPRPSAKRFVLSAPIGTRPEIDALSKLRRRSRPRR